jgi:site-specific recombinase XerD
MNLLQQFVDFLNGQKNKPSPLTVKNYKADVRQFINWIEKELNSLFDPTKITPEILQKYKTARGLSGRSMDRHDSSLRKFVSFLKAQKIITFDLLPISNDKSKIEIDPWMIKNFKDFLYSLKKSNLTIKNYINDIKSFFAWFTEVALIQHAWNIADKDLFSKINSSVIEEYKQRLLTAQFSPLSINRKLSSLRSYVSWAKSQGFIKSIGNSISNTLLAEAHNMPVSEESAPIAAEESAFAPVRVVKKTVGGINSVFDTFLIFPIAESLQHMQNLFWRVTGRNIFKKSKFQDSDEISNIKKEFYAPLSISVRYLPAYKRIWHYIRYARPNWYKRYHSYAFTHYFHFAILVTLSCAIGFGAYGYFFADKTENSVLGTAISAPPRILSFQGKLTDSSEAPITTEKSVLFSLYDDENAALSSALWKENDTVRPNLDGTFSILLGRQTALSNSIFSQNSRLFLGIAIGGGPELRPRQELATVSLASNTETLQGLEPITNSTKTSNVVLALNSSGNLNIADAKTHTFQAIGGSFVLSGKVLSLITVPGSDSNVEISPDGMGKIDLLKPIQNSSNSNNLAPAMGAVEFDDMVAILATTSAQAALYINQNSTGTLISASTNEIAKFTVDNGGTGIFSGNLGINGDNLTSTATNFNLLNSNVTNLNIGGAATTLNLGVLGGNTTIKSNLVLSSLSANGGILYADGSGKISQTLAGSGSDCLMGGSKPSFNPCSNIFNQTDKVGIGTNAPLFRLDVQDSKDATATAQIFNTSTNPDADGLIIKLGNASASAVASTNHFISFETSGIGIVGSIRGNNDGVQYQTNGIADFAEYFKKDKDQIIEYGSVVCLNSDGMAVKCDGQNNKIIGVASEHPAFLGGKNLGNGSITVGLVGQVETLVADVNGEIKAGDILTTSNIPGVAVKAIKAGQIIGKALGNLTAIDESKVIGYYNPDNKEYRSKTNFPNIPLKSNIIRVFKIYALVSPSWYDPNTYLAQNGDLIIRDASPSGYFIAAANGEDLANIEGFFKVVAANIEAGLVNASEIITKTLIVTSDSIIVNGQNLRDYVAGIISDLKSTDTKNTLPIVNANQLSADIISPLSSPSLIVKLSTPSGSLVVQNASGSAVAKIDDQGNASFSGTISSKELQANDASVSGTLRAGNIIADSIEGLEAKVSSYINLASYSAQLSYVPDLAAERAQFNQGLMVFGPTSLADLSLAGRLSINNTMFITENSIETLGTDLSLQSLKLGGLSVMGGLVYIDTEGNVKIQKDLSVSGKLAVNIISPNPLSDLTVKNASGSSVLSISQLGDMIASGSGTFAKLNFNLVAPALAVSATEAIASSSAGIANVAPYQSEITIKNPLVTDKSVIYITPVGTPSSQAPFLMRQNSQEQNNSFTVGVQSPTNHPIYFNWLIIN